MQSVVEVDIRQNLLQAASRHILQCHQAQLPDLSSLIILLPHQSAATAFRQQLLDTLTANSDEVALLPPWCGTLQDWITRYIPQEKPADIITGQTRRLLFVETLADFPRLYREENKWQVSQALLSLFDELTLQQTDIPDARQWKQFIQGAYGLHEHPHCNREAEIVHRLWHAWHQMLDEAGIQDVTGDYITRLYHAQELLSSQQFPSNDGFYSLGNTHYSQSEIAFLEQLAKEKYTQIRYKRSTSEPASTPPDYKTFISQCFSGAIEDENTLPFKQRIQAMGSTDPDIPFSYFPATDEENQVRAIELQIRLWLLDNRQTIGVVCEDRKLARRLRALLDRADVAMQDLSGWSLATTQAASIIERWLQCIEEDFDSRPLLDCLKSTFTEKQWLELLALTNPESETDQAEYTDQSDQYRYLIYRFEHDIILHENINSNIDRYRKHLSARKTRLIHWPTDSYSKLIKLLNHIENQATPLKNLCNLKNTVPASHFLNALISSLESLGVHDAYQRDAAGLRILQTFDDLQTGLHYSDPLFSWQDFRLWLGNALEEKLFSPQTQSTGVKLLTLEQTELMNFDALIIAALEPGHFPGKARTNPFFNQSVRKALGLTNWKDDYRHRFELFERLLFSSPEILLTALAEDKGEPIPVSPWLELMLQFYQQLYGKQPLNTELPGLLESDSQVFRCDTDTLPSMAERPSPVLETSLIPSRFSASAHQRLINCPYQFFCSDGLKLKPVDEISLELQKSDYGERVHTILQCFHGACNPDNGHAQSEAFYQPVTSDNREQAIQHLRQLSELIFQDTLEDNILHRSWLQRWLKHIPSYIDWQINQQKSWWVHRTEENASSMISDHCTLYGRLDRIDIHNKYENELAIIDYKTGRSASQNEIECGEDIQLTSYALLEQNASQVKYLSLDSSEHKVKTAACLQGDRLDTLRQQTRSRLQDMVEAINQQAPLPAWGAETICRYCTFSGICRRQQWENTPS